MRMAANDHAVLQTFARLAGADGTTKASLRDVARVLGKAENTVSRSVRNLIDGGFLVRESIPGRGNTQLTRVVR